MFAHSMDGTLEPPRNIIGVTQSSAKKHVVNGSLTPWCFCIYITQPSATPEDHIVKAVGDLTSALRSCINARGTEQMDMLVKLNNALTNTTSKPPAAKTVTFKDPTPQPRVIPTAALAVPTAVPATKPAPRVRGASKPRVTRAVIDKPFGAVPTRYSPAAAAAPVYDLLFSPGSETACEVFDAESGKFLKYRKLITHPAHHEAWTLSSANEFRHLAQGIGGCIKGTHTIFFIHKSEVPADQCQDVTYAKFVCELKPPPHASNCGR